MALTKKEITTDLSMLTGKVSTDVSYLVYLILKDNPNLSNEPIYSELTPRDSVESLDDWFDKMGETL